MHSADAVACPSDDSGAAASPATLAHITDLLVCCAATVKLSMGDFEPTIVVDRNLTVTASNNTASGVQPTLNFNHGINLILVSVSTAELSRVVHHALSDCHRMDYGWSMVSGASLRFGDHACSVLAGGVARRAHILECAAGATGLGGQRRCGRRECGAGTCAVAVRQWRAWGRGEQSCC